MNKMLSLSRQGSLQSGLSEFDEEKVIETALVTPYEKVIKILQKVIAHLETCAASISLGKEVDWVIKRIRSHKLYSYEGLNDQSSELEKLSKTSQEVQSFLGFLNQYSEHKEFKRRDKDAKVSKTTVVKDKINFLKRKPLNKIESKDSEASSPVSHKNPEHSLFFPGKFSTPSESDKNDLKFDDSEDDMSPINKKSSFHNNKSKILLTVHDEFDSNEPRNLGICLENCNDDRIILTDYIQSSILFEITFNIFDFIDSVGIENVLVRGATELITNLGLNSLISEEYLSNFLLAIRDGYKNPPYHTAVHGLDVMQTVCIYISHSNMCELLYLNDLDILALTIGSLAHDIGHPGYNNGFQVNFLTEMAIVYNDKSVLENYHITQTFKILQKDQANIFKKLTKSEFRLVRKRMIEAILATDMLFHSKIVALVKNRLEINGISKGNNTQNIIEQKSQNLFDDQQEILNFLIHIADISHNSKDFKISQRWTECLMNEFWRQGDYEREHGMSISFLCDRETADVPKSQIGFIKAIIIPTFDILIDFLPDLGYYQMKVRNNLEEWTRIVKERERQKEMEQLRMMI